MAGYRHHADCTCGWCIGHSGKSDPIEAAAARAESWPGAQATLESYTIPNAKCPLCGTAVYFYQSPYGGRVFFDELGPPWPKHFCTDKPLSIGSAVVKPQRPSWQEAGWIPVDVVSIERRLSGDWDIVALRRLDTGHILYRAIERAIALRPKVPVLMKDLDRRGLGMISWSLGQLPKEGRLAFRGYSFTPTVVLQRALGGDVDAMTEVGLNVSLRWRGPTGRADASNAPKWMRMKFGRAWLQEAAQLGSSTALDALVEHETSFT